MSARQYEPIESATSVLTYVCARTDRARDHLAHVTSATSGPADADAMFDVVQQLSDDLKWAADRCGSDAVTRRRLLSLRETLDSHLLTGFALAACDLGDAAVPTMLARGLNAVADGLRPDAPSERVRVH
jgi:hypothetical protein